MPNDRFAVNAVVVILGVISLVGLGIIGLLALNDKPIPVELVGITGPAVGAVSGLLASTRSNTPAPPAGGGLR